MDVGSIVNGVSNVGFPVMCTIGLAFFIYKIWQKMSEQQEKLTTTLVEVNTTNKELSETNKKLVEELSKDVKKIKDVLEVRSNED